MPKILYIARCAPAEGASGVRIATISRLLRENNNEVWFFVNKTGKEKRIDNNVFYLKKNCFSGLSNLFDIINGNFSFTAFRKICTEIGINMVILYNQPYVFAKKVIKYCKKQNIKVVIDNTEWYEQEPIKNGVANYIFRKSIDKRIRFLDHKSDGIIAISDFLKGYYLKKGVRVINIPPLMDMSDYQFGYTNNENVKLIYAGSPGNKDILAPIIKSLIKYNQCNKRIIQLDIYGIDNEYLNASIPDFNFPNYGISAHGRQDRSLIIEKVAQANFSMLFRYPLRYAKAGYSSKMAESLSLGTPVLCNSIGGSDKDISNGITGFVIDDYEESTLFSIFDKMNSQSRSDYQNMREQCKLFANRRYSTDSYSDSLNQFILSL